MNRSCRDIRFPSATIHPDYLTYLVELTDGRVLKGVPRTEGDELVIGDDKGREVRARRSDVEGLHPSALSIMPEGLEKAVGPERDARPSHVPADGAAEAGAAGAGWSAAAPQAG